MFLVYIFHLWGATMKFIIEQSNEDLTPLSGLALVGALINKTALKLRLDKSKVPGVLTPQITHGEIAKAYLGLLCQGKSDFDHIEPFRDDPFFRLALQLKEVPSSPTLRQRLDMAARNPEWNQIILEESVNLIRKSNAPLTPLVLGSAPSKRRYLPLDIDVSPFDNSNTKKEGVSRTYKGHDGYAPIFAYVGQEGYGIHTELREGKNHSQKGTEEFLAQSIRYAKRLSSIPLLVRMDSGNDSTHNIRVLLEEDTKADFIIKRNLRRETAESWLAIAKENGSYEKEREGKIVYTGSILRKPKNLDRDIRIVYRVIERTVLANGQILLVPDIEVETYWTTLPDPVETIIELYHNHGTCEQFHSEIKTDLDLERLPSGKFATNDLILHLGIFAYNILRIMGQMTVNLNSVPLRKKAQRRRIRTVIQNLITIASRLVCHARQIKLRFGRHSPWLGTFQHIYAAFG